MPPSYDHTTAGFILYLFKRLGPPMRISPHTLACVGGYFDGKRELIERSVSLDSFTTMLVDIKCLKVWRFLFVYGFS